MHEPDVYVIAKGKDHTNTVISYNKINAPSNDKTITLIPNSEWDDYTYRTAFNLKKAGKPLGTAKIGFKHQSARDHTKNKIPVIFDRLGEDFFSRIKFSEAINDIYSEKQKQNICQSLNDIRVCPEIAKQHQQEDVIKKSLFRDDPESYQKWRKSIKN